MKIIIDQNHPTGTQSAIVTIDTSTCFYPYAIKKAIKLALELDGVTQEAINEIFGKPSEKTQKVKED